MHPRHLRNALFLAGLGAVLAGCGAAPTAPEPETSVHFRSLALTAVECETPADIGALLDQLEADEVLNHGRATALRSHLANAQKHEAAGRAKQAADAYDQLLSQVQGWVDGGALDADDVADLFACVDDVLDGPEPEPEPDPEPAVPVIDGVKSPGEWDAATAVAVWTGGTLYYTNDDTNLYLALEMVDEENAADGFRMRFDDTMDGVFTVGDNEIVVRMDSYFDRHRTDFGWGVDDTQKDGTRASGASAGVNFFEVSFPLDSGDTNDFQLSPGDAVGYCVQYLDNGLAMDSASYPRVAAFDNCMLDSDQANYAVMTTSP